MPDDTEPDLRPTAEPITAVLADRERTFREGAGMSQAAVAEAMSRGGVPWKRATVVNLERRGTSSRKRGAPGGRDAVTIEELFALALVFDVPPVWLLADPRRGEPVPMPDGTELDPWSALLWLTGAQRLPDDRSPHRWDEAAQALGWASQVAFIARYLVQADEARVLQETLATGIPASGGTYVGGRPDAAAAEASDRTLFGHLVTNLGLLVKHGFVVPALPAYVVERARELDVELPGVEG